MINIILDTNIILRYPKILGLNLTDITFLIPLDVIDELSARSKLRATLSGKIIKLIERSSQDGNVAIINTDLPSFRSAESLINFSNLSGTDKAIMATALTYIQRGETVKIATQDKAIQKIALEHKIDILTDEDIKQLLQNFFRNKLTQIKKEIKSYEQEQIWDLILKSSIGVLLSVGIKFISKDFQFIISTINIWGTILLILLCGILLFILREKQRLIYGIFEFFIGALIIVMLFQAKNFNLSEMNLNIEFGIKVLGGLYIMVRGQDNILKAIGDTKIGLYLKNKFGIGT